MTGHFYMYVEKLGAVQPHKDILHITQALNPVLLHVVISELTLCSMLICLISEEFFCDISFV